MIFTYDLLSWVSDAESRETVKYLMEQEAGGRLHCYNLTVMNLHKYFTDEFERKVICMLKF